MCVFVYMCFCVLFNLSCKAHQRPLCSRQGPLCSVWNILTYRTLCHVFYFDDVSLGQNLFLLHFFFFISSMFCVQKSHLLEQITDVISAHGRITPLVNSSYSWHLQGAQRLFLFYLIKLIYCYWLIIRTILGTCT